VDQDCGVTRADNSRQAIPTRYGGVNFRSRIEARWAATFDMHGWRWEYEPLDLAGYIPDFVLLLHEPLLVEVKGALTLDELRPHTRKIDRSGWDGEALIVGATPDLADGTNLSFPDGAVAGLLRERIGNDGDSQEDWWWGPAIWFFCRNCRRLSLLHSMATWRCRVTGCYDGDHHVEPEPCGSQKLRQCWTHVGNLTQWQQ